MLLTTTEGSASADEQLKENAASVLLLEVVSVDSGN